jgi:hypothetical protein
MIDNIAYDVCNEIWRERLRQTSEEGWTPEHDDAHDRGELALAAFSYLGHGAKLGDFHDAVGVPEPWPFEMAAFKPSTPRRDLIKAAALIVAEIERRDRASVAKLAMALPVEASR